MPIVYAVCSCNFIISQHKLLITKEGKMNLKISKKWTVLKNYVAFNVSFIFLYAAVTCVASIESIINPDQNLGQTGQISLHVVETVTCLVLPQLIIEQIGFKYTLMLSQLLQSFYIAVQIHFRSYTIIPGNV